MKVFRDKLGAGVLIMYGPNSYIDDTDRGVDYFYEDLWYDRASPLWKYYTKLSVKNYYETL